MARPRESGDLPSRDEVLRFIKQQRSPVGRREIAREFKLDSDNRQRLADMLDSLEEEKLIHRARNRRYSTGRKIPPVGVLEVTGLDRDGEPVLSIVGHEGATQGMTIHLARGHQRGRAPGIGDRVLARLDRKSDSYCVAHVMRRLETSPSRLFGMFQTDSRGGGQIVPVSKRLKSNFHVSAGDTGGAEAGEFVSAEVLRGRQYGMPIARIAERIGTATKPGGITRLAIAANDIPDEFSQAALAEAEAATAAPMAARDDLRDVPLVTIDDETARDFDDAVWAEPDSDPGNKGGWHLIVAIADVAWYVRPDSPLDSTAHERGNSVYLPNKVVPMLPEALSNGWCSLNPDEDRPCLAVDIWIDAEGNKRRHWFRRAMMRSAARLTYKRVQALRDGEPTEGTPPDGLIESLYGAFDALFRERTGRGALDLDLPERRVVLNPDGTIKGVETRLRHDSHRLIEEFMILANVCAAETLEEKGQPCMYRVHDDPAPDRVVALRQYLETLGLSLGGGQAVRPRNFAQLIKRLKGRKDAAGVQDAILRCQAQAVYSPDNLGHFGLALRNYAHFTSPIRRYSDLLVHRALIRGLRLGEGALEDDAGERFAEIGTHISMTERRAMAAERDAFDRLATLYLADRIGARFMARITGVERFGLFVELEETGASGLLPISLLGDERFEHDPRRAALIGQTSQKTYALGDGVEVKLSEADPASGKLSFDLADGGPGRGGNTIPRRPPLRKGSPHHLGAGKPRKRRK